MSKRIAFEHHCGYWPLPKQVSVEEFTRRLLSSMPLPRGPDPVPTDSPEWFDLVEGKQGAGEPRSPVSAVGERPLSSHFSGELRAKLAAVEALPSLPSPRGPGDPRVCRHQPPSCRWGFLPNGEVACLGCGEVIT